MKTQHTKNKFIELRAKGFSYDKIAKQLRVSKQTLISWSKEYETEIANLKAIELEATGWTRATFIVKEDYLEKLKALAYWNRKQKIKNLSENSKKYRYRKTIKAIRC